jgi:MFS family permease
MIFKPKIKDNGTRNEKQLVAGFLGLKESIVPLLIITLLIYSGEKLWERFLPKYFESIGASVFIIGGLGFLQNMLGAIWALQGGYLTDRFGTKKSFLLFNLLAIAGYLIAIIFTSWIAVFIGMIFFSAWSNISLPGSMSLITNVLGTRKTVMGISMHSFIRRIPMAIGPVIGGLIVMHFGIIKGIKISFSISILLSLAGLIFQQKIRDQIKVHYEFVHPVKLWKKMDIQLKKLLVSDILIRFCEQIPYVFVVIWCLDRIKISPANFGVLTAIEMIVAALIYIPVASYSDKLEKKPFVALTFFFFTLFPIILFFSKSYPALMIAFIIRGLKEFGEPTRKALITDFCPVETRARTFGLYYFVRDFTVSFAAFFGGLLWMRSPELNLLSATGFGILGTLFFILFGKGTPARAL